jgi:hypothetical protein
MKFGSLVIKLNNCNFRDEGNSRRTVNANKSCTLPHALPQKNRNLVKALKTKNRPQPVL